MILEQYAEQSLLCNVSVNGLTSTKDNYAFRGDIVIEEGEIADTQGRRLPPKSVVKQAVVLVSANKIKMIAGALDDIVQVPEFVGKYGSDFSDDIKLLFYVSNINKAVKVTIDGKLSVLLPHDEGAVWTMLMDDLRLEKSDFKGQSAENKVITMFEALESYVPKCEEKSYNDALGYTVEVKKEARGPV